MVVDSSNNFLLTLQDILNPDLSFIFGKMQVIKQYSRFSRFLLLRQDYRLNYFVRAGEEEITRMVRFGALGIEVCILVEIPDVIIVLCEDCWR